MKLLLRTLPISAPVLLAGVAGISYGQSDSSLPDPTRPPLAIDGPVSAGTEGVPPPSGLQTVIRGKGHKPMAVINGEIVELGGKVGDAILVKISESEVVLRGPTGQETLHLTPGVEKMNRLNPKRGISVESTRTVRRPKPESTQ